jgi:hypothetical protein
MTSDVEEFENALEEYLLCVSGLPAIGEHRTVAAAVANAPADHPVHALGARAFRCQSCRKAEFLKDIAIDIDTGAPHCPACEGTVLHLVREGLA